MQVAQDSFFTMHDLNKDGFLDEHEVRAIYSGNSHIQVNADADAYVREIWRHSDTDGAISQSFLVLGSDGLAFEQVTSAFRLTNST